ncbi:hypothetical protein SynBIOSE41_03105 [Synechococcus sp. BIOS-E4-1]|nr:hypothetical protein SynBIOSE41_03105 [Synechococcus sp. BIOS-E4-1]
MASTKSRPRPEIDYAQLLKEMSRLDLADRLLINRKGDLP